MLRGLFSIVIVVAIVMILIYGCLNKDQIFANDSVYVHMKSNAKTTYKLQQWEKYGYVDYVTYAEWMTDLLRDGGISEKDYKTAVVFGDTPSKDNALAAEYIFGSSPASCWETLWKRRSQNAASVSTPFSNSS